MHNINKTLLKKYFAGACTKREIILVEEWLEFGEYHEPLELSPEVKSAHKQEMWQNIANNIQQEEIKIIPLYKRLRRYAAAVCLVLGLIDVGFITARKTSLPNTTISSVEPKSQLHITSGSSKITKIEGNYFDLKFNGMIEVYNASKTKTTIICDDKTFELEPLKSYFLKGSQDEATIIKGSSSGEYPLSRMLKRDFSIHLTKA